MTLAPDVRAAEPEGSPSDIAVPACAEAAASPVDERPVEFWPTAAIREALDTGDLRVWQGIAAAIKRDPYGRTARQVEEVLETGRPYGVSAALAEVLARTRDSLEAHERREVAHQVRLLLKRSGLAQPEFASRIGVPADEFARFVDGHQSPSASLMVRMSRLSDRFAKMRAYRSGDSH